MHKFGGVQIVHKSQLYKKRAQLHEKVARYTKKMASYTKKWPGTQDFVQLHNSVPRPPPPPNCTRNTICVHEASYNPTHFKYSYLGYWRGCAR